MEQQSNTTKVLLVVILFVVLIAAIIFQFMRMRPQPTESIPPPPVQAEPAAPQVEAPTAAPAVPAEAEPAVPPVEGGVEEEVPGETAPATEAAPAPPAPPETAEPAEAPEPSAGVEPEAAKPEAASAEAPQEPEPPARAQRPERKRELPEISFMDEKIDEEFRNSRFFVVNDVVPAKNPFVPQKTLVPVRTRGGRPEQLGPDAAAAGEPGAMVPGGEGEVPLLPLPGETLGEIIQIKLIGVSSGSESAAALFDVDGEVVLAHPGWLVGNDYVFVGAQFGKANLFDRKTNRIIQLASGETL